MSKRAQTYQFCRAVLCPLAVALVTSFTHTARASKPRAVPPPASAAAQARGDAEVARLVALVRDARADDSDALEGVRAAGYELLGAGRYADAERIFAALVGKWPRDRDALYGAALALFNLRRSAEAEPLARAAVRESLPTAWPAAGGLARDQSAHAASFRRRASDAQTLLAYVLGARGDVAGSLGAAREAARLTPDSFDAQFAFGRALYGAGDAAGAAAAFAEAVRLRPADAQARFFLATTLERANETAAAEREYRELVARAPRDVRGHLGLGVLLAKGGGASADEGIASLQRAVALDPASYEARAALGRALVRANRHAEAVEHLLRAAALAPDNPEPQFQLAIAYRRLGRTEDAARASATVRRIHERRRGVRNDKPDEKPDE